MESVVLEPLLVSVEQAATLLALSRSQVYALMDRRKLAFARFGGARRIPMADLLAYIESNTTKAL